MLLEQKTTDFLEQLSSSAPIPGGGGASAAVGAFASALGLMVTNLTVGKKKYADVEEEILEIREKLEQKKQDLVRMVDEDAEAFEPLAKAYSCLLYTSRLPLTDGGVHLHRHGYPWKKAPVRYRVPDSRR